MAQAAPAKKKKVFDGRYEILAIVGRGSGSVVYRARHVTAPHNEVALKVLVNKKGGAPSSDQLRKEALAMVSSRHKYTVRLDDFHSVGQLCYLSMEYAPEGDLRKYIARHAGKLNLTQIERFMLQIAEALAFIHQAGILHRDLKPENILVVNDRQVRLADFGVAVLPGEESSIEELQKGVGTMDYMAPEVLEAVESTKQSDVYLYGVTFYEIITGTHPFSNIPLAQVIEARKDSNIKPVSELRPDCPKHLANIITRALSFNPADRFTSARDMFEALLAGKAAVANSDEFPDTPVEKVRPVTSPAPSSKNDVVVEKAPVTTAPLQNQTTTVEKVSVENSKPAVTAADLKSLEEDDDTENTTSSARGRRKRRRRRRRAQPDTAIENAGENTPKTKPGVATTVEPALKAEKNPSPAGILRPAQPPLRNGNQKEAPIGMPISPAPKNTVTKNNAPAFPPLQGAPEQKSPSIMKPALDLEVETNESESNKESTSNKSDSVFATKKSKSTPVRPQGGNGPSAAMGVLFGEVEGEGPTRKAEEPTKAPPKAKAGSPWDKKDDADLENDKDNGVFQPIQSTESKDIAEIENDVDDYIEEDFYGSSTDHYSGAQKMLNPNMDSKQKSWFLRMMVIVIVLFVADDLTRRWTDKGLAERAMEITGLSHENSLLPYVSASALPFPNVPEGQYAGIITGVIKDTPLPLSITRPTDSENIYISIGIRGWVPAAVPVSAEPSAVRVRSSGLILTFSGVDTGEEIQGTFINSITGEEGTWVVSPIRKR